MVLDDTATQGDLRDLYNSRRRTTNATGSAVLGGQLNWILLGRMVLEIEVEIIFDERR
jgi:hypothetical protein